MPPEEIELLKKSVALAEDNNTILHSMRRSQRYSTIANYVYWIIIIGIAAGAFYFLQPYFDQIKILYTEATSTLKNFSSR